MKKVLLIGILFLLTAHPGQSLMTGRDLIVPAAGRGGGWVTDLYVMNPGTEITAVSISWLVRDHENPAPAHADYSLSPGETLNLEDVVLSAFGLSSAGGAFRIRADHEVLVNSRIYSASGDQTFGQGFEGVPVEAATAASESSDTVGLAYNDSFRTNIYGCATNEGATLSLSLRSPDGSEIATATKTLRPWEPFLQKANTLLGSGNFDAGTLHVRVSAGAAVIGASKVDNASTDPTTLESSLKPALPSDGSYEFSLKDSEASTGGGSLHITGGTIDALSGSYVNWEKDGDNDGVSDCPLQFQWGGAFVPADLAELEDGVSFTDSYSGGGDIRWTLSLSVDHGQSLSGTLAAVGSDFPSSTDPQQDLSGCNGSFPTLSLSGGKLAD